MIFNGIRPGRSPVYAEERAVRIDTDVNHSPGPDRESRSTKSNLNSPSQLASPPSSKHPVMRTERVPRPIPPGSRLKRSTAIFADACGGGNSNQCSASKPSE